MWWLWLGRSMLLLLKVGVNVDGIAVVESALLGVVDRKFCGGYTRERFDNSEASLPSSSGDSRNVEIIRDHLRCTSLCLRVAGGFYWHGEELYLLS